MIKGTYNILVVILVSTLIFACKKLDYDDGITRFGEVYFQNESVLDNDLGVKLQGGDPIDMELGTGRIRVPEGEHTFVFYNKRNNEDLAEKKFNVVVGNTESYKIFQPSESDPLAFLDPDGQVDEEAAPEGFMKIKIANYSSSLLPNPVDVVFHGLVGRAYVVTDTIKNIGGNLEEEEYHLVKRGAVADNRPTYQLSFINHQTKEEVKNIGETVFYSTTISFNGTKHVYTIYLTPSERDFESPAFLKSEDKFYTVIPSILYKD